MIQASVMALSPVGALDLIMPQSCHQCAGVARTHALRRGEPRASDSARLSDRGI
jgi:hypothetical protein